MKAVEAKLLKFLQKTYQLIIPIYQRAYSWQRAQCQQLWSEIMRVARDSSASAHFIGSVVFIAQGIKVLSQVPKLLVTMGSVYSYAVAGGA